MPVRLWRNYKASDCPVPVLVLLHGSGECGLDNARHLPAFAPIHRQALIDDDIPPALYIVPQCTQRNAWVRNIAFQEDYRLPRYPAPALRTVKEYLDKLIADGVADPERIYLAGLSLGGFGTWDAIQRWPDYFAAAVPICGGGSLQENAIKNAATTSIWIFHGDKDVNVPVACSRRMVAKLTSFGAQPKYTEYENAGHNVWGRAFKDTALLKWIFRQRRGRIETVPKRSGFWGQLKAYVTPD
ncbi:MAG: prolyl oligopeptidase family serine peptidase [Kiritimatiellae bacterium]|nr:prolyl oligopeptidase family serine peptidase [Kiritimatiellia bacterium]